jgi:hypothetical protein
MIMQPVHFTWREVDITDADGVVTRTYAMVPSLRYRRIAERQFGGGGEYALEPVTERSAASHSQYFAALHDLYQNVPEQMQARWPNEAHFRAWLLMETGWCNEFECKKESLPHVKKFLLDNKLEFARLFNLKNGMVLVRYPKSQSRKAMGSADFERSKKDVLDLASSLVGTTRTEAMKNAGRAA